MKHQYNHCDHYVIVLSPVAIVIRVLSGATVKDKSVGRLSFLLAEFSQQ